MTSSVTAVEDATW